MKRIIWPILIVILTAASCSVRQEILLNINGSGEFTGRVILDDFYLGTLLDLTDLNTPTEGGASPMDPQSVSRELMKNPFFRNVRVQSSGPGLYEGYLEFHEVEKLFYTDQGKPGSVVSFRQNGESSTLTIRINKDNFQELFTLFPVLQDPGFQYFLPEKGITRREYTDMLLFLFEDRFEEGDAELETRIIKASLNLTIRTDGRILSYRGGQKTGSGQWEVKIPLLDLLLLEKELYYSVTYQ